MVAYRRPILHDSNFGRGNAKAADVSTDYSVLFLHCRRRTVLVYQKYHLGQIVSLSIRRSPWEVMVGRRVLVVSP